MKKSFNCKSSIKICYISFSFSCYILFLKLFRNVWRCLIDNISLFEACVHYIHVSCFSSTKKNPCKTGKAWNKYILLHNIGRKPSLLMKFGQFAIIQKKKKIKTFSKKSYMKTNFFEATYFCSTKLSEFAQISKLTSSHSFLQRILWKLKKAWN